MLSISFALRLSIWSVVLFNLIASRCAHEFSRTVNTANGLLRGILVTEDVGDLQVTYESYQGIPYAKPPLGKLRFKDPEPSEEWNGTLEANQFGSVCPQTPDFYTEDEMDEDCLTLNIYVPATAKQSSPLPVFFFVHGGQFKSGGSKAFRPKFLVAKDVIVVTTNYRLGCLGFFALENSTEAVGNAGLKDVLMALRWVHHNIAAFGGDPKKITAGGQSAGSVAVNYLLLADIKNNPINNVILSSGPAIGYRFLSYHTRDQSFEIAAKLGYNRSPTDHKTIVSYLRTFRPMEIVTAQESIAEKTTQEFFGFRPFTPFAPIIEDASVSKHPLITENPLKSTKEGIRRNVPILAGVNAQEGITMLPTLLQNSGLIEEINNSFERCVPTDIGRTLNDTQRREIADKIKKFYFGDQELTEGTISSYLDLIMDTMYFHGVDYTLRLHSARKDAKPVYYYMFDFDGELNYGKIIGNVTHYPGTCHSDEIGYTWDINNVKNIVLEKNSPSALMRERLVDVWTNFVKYSDPTPVTTPTMKLKWIPIQYPSINYMHLKAEPNMGTDPYRKRSKFWEEVYGV